MKIIIRNLIVFVLLILAVVIGVNSQEKLEQKPEEISLVITDYFVFSCPSGDKIKIRYDNINNEAILLFQDQIHVLKRVISGSGARYTNNEETIVFWEHQGEVTLGIDGEIVAQNCLLDERINKWLEFKSDGIIFQAPKSLEIEYVALHKWPPEIKILNNINGLPLGIEIKKGELKCLTTPEESSFSKRFYQQNINGRTYCIRAESEGAAGSVYTDYSYYTIYKQKLISINFVLRFSNCSHYPEPERIECVAEREAFDIGNIINEIVETIFFACSDYS